MGLKEGDSIRCRHHGLKLGPDGCAEEMPLRTGPVNKGICVETFAVVERHRFIWLWVGDKAKADPALIPDFWPCSTPGWVVDGDYYRVACDYRLMIDNLMDLTHETYGLSFLQAVGTMTGMSPEDYQAMMVAGGRSPRVRSIREKR